MEFSNLEAIITLIVAIVGAIGGIPQLLRWATPKPHLKLNNASFVKKSDNKFNLHLELENKKRWWYRNKDAINVLSSWYMMDKNNVQWMGYERQSLSPYLLSGKKILRDFDVIYPSSPEGNPHSIVVLIGSNEGTLIKNVISYEEKT